MSLYLDNSDTIGGYFQLQLASREEYYPSLIKLNTNRNALEYILTVRQYTKIYIPYFTCSVMLEPILKMNIPFDFYVIDSQLDPVLDFEIGANECLLCTNYFGLKNITVNGLCKTIKNIIIDNAQAFFASPLPGVDTIYSCRKFFGVADGAYLALNTHKRLSLPTDVSASRIMHLIESIDVGKEQAFNIYHENEKRLENQGIKHMSALTQKILAGIDYQSCINSRNDNFNFLHENLVELNELHLEMPIAKGPLAYPFLIQNADVKKRLIAEKIFTPTYWPNVFEWTTPKMFENYLAKHLVSLPIDHRYTLSDMKVILKSLKRALQPINYFR
ncbi:MAG: hypothetical protein EOO47_15360 [Flavobacterium sp.]|nr:MAG: hypothetical protein EOO47_15360 [Flavobacterium sp.]